MNNCINRAILFLLLICSFTNVSALSSKPEKFLSILLKKPGSEFLFDRFYNLSLQEMSTADLEQFLTTKYEETKNNIYLQLLAYSYEEEGELAKAIEIYDQIITDKSSPSLIFRRGQANFMALNFASAIKDLEHALSGEPKEVLEIKINKLLGKIYIRELQVEKGLAIWIKLSEKLQDQDLSEEILELMIAEGLYKQAQAQIEKFMVTCKSNHQKITLMLRSGNLFRKQYMNEKSLKVYAQALDKVGSESWIEKEILSQIEQVFRTEDDLSGLNNFFGKLLKVRKNNIELMKRQAALSVELGALTDAENSYLKIVRLTPTDRVNKEVYCNFLIKHHKYDKALSLFMSLKKESPADLEVLLSLANIYHKKKDKQLCYAELKQYNLLSKNSEEALGRSAALLSRFEMTTEAILIYDQLVKKSPNNIDYRLLRAQMLYEDGKRILAIKAYKELGESGDLESLQRIVMILNGIKAFKAVEAILKFREADFKTEFKYQQLCYKSNVQLKNSKEELLSAELMMKTANDFYNLKSSIDTLYYLSQKSNDVESIFEKIHSKSKLTPNETILTSELSYKADELDKAFSILKALISVKGHGQALALKQQLSLEKRGKNWDASIKTLVLLTEVEPKSKVKYLTELVDVCFNANKDKQGFEFIEKWKKASPSAMSPYFKEAAKYKSDGNLSKAIALLKKTMFKFQDHTELAIILANYMSYNMDFRGARSIYWNLIGKENTLSIKLSHVAKLIQLSQRDGTITSLINKLKTRMDNNPKSIFPLLALAEVCRYNSYEDRRHYLLKATELRSNDVSLLKEIARIEESEGQYNEALMTLKKINKLDSSSVSRQLLIKFYLSNGEEQLALDLVSDISSSKPMTADEQFSTASSLVKAKSTKAKQLVNSCLIKYPLDYRFAFLKAIILKNENKNDEAIATFLTILEFPDTTKKAPKVSNKPTASMNRSYLNSIFSKETEEFISKNAFFGTSILYYRLKDVNYKKLLYPTTFKEIRKYLIAYVITMVNTLEQKDRDSWLRKMSAQGIAYADIHYAIYALNVLRLNNSGETIRALQQHYKEDKTAVDLLTYLRGQTIMDAKEFSTYVEEIKVTNPEFLMQVVIAAHQRGIKIRNETTLNLITKQILTKEVTTFTYRLGILIMSSNKVSVENKNKLTKKILEDFFQNKNNGHNQGFWQVPAVMLILLNNDDYPKLVKVFDMLMTNPTKRNNYSYSSHSSYSSNQTRLVDPLNFTTLINTKINHRIISVLSQRNQQLIGNQPQKKIDKEKLAKHIKLIKSPILRLYLYHTLNKKDLALQEASKRLTEKDLKAYDYELIAALYFKYNKLNEGITTLEKSLSLAKKFQEIKKLSGLILFYTTKVKGEKYKNMNLKYAKKILKGRTTLAEKGEILGYLMAQDNSELSKKLEKQIITLIKKNPKRSTRYRSNNKTPSKREQVRNLLEANKNKEAIELASREYRRIVRSFLVIKPQRNHNSSWDIERLIDYVKRYKKEKAFLAKLAPKSKDSFDRSLVEYAYAQQKFGNNEKAIEVYRSVIAKNSENRIAHLMLGTLLIQKDLEKSFEHIFKGIGNDYDSALAILQNQIDNANRTVEFLNYIPLVTRLLKKMNSSPSFNSLQNNSHVLTSIISSFTREINFRNPRIRIPDLFDPNPIFTDQKTKEKEMGLSAKRRKHCLELYKESVNIPLLAISYFGKLNNLLEYDGASLEERVEYAKKALKLQSSMHYYGQVSFNQSFNGKQVIISSPSDLLITYAYKQNKYDEIVKFFETFSGSQPHIFDKLKKLKPLYDSSEGEFIAAANKFIEVTFQYGSPSIGDIIKAREIKQYKVDLSEVILKKLEKSLAGDGLIRTVIPEIGKWLTVLEKENNKKWFMNFTSKSFSQLAHKIEELQKNHPDSKSLRRDQLWYPCRNIITEFIPRESSLKRLDTIFEVIEKHRSESFDLLLKDCNLSPRFYNAPAFNGQGYGEIIDSPLCNELKTFSPILAPFSDDIRYSSALASLINKVKGSSHQIKTLKKLLNDREQQTFGTKLLLTLLNEKETQKVYDFMEGYLSELKKLPKEKQQRLLTSLNLVMQLRPFKQTRSAVKGNFYNYLKEYTKGNEQDKFRKFMKEDINTYGGDYNYRLQAKQLIIELIDEHPSLAQQVLNRALKQMKLYYLTNINNYSGNSTRPGGDLISQLASDMSEKKALFIVKNMDQVVFLNPENKSRFLRSLLRRLRYDCFDKKKETRKESYFHTVVFFLDKIYNQVKLDDLSMGALLSNLLEFMSKKNLKNILQRPELEDPQGWKLQEIHALTSLFLQRKVDSELPPPQEFIDFYTDYLSDKKVPLETRISVMNSLPSKNYIKETKSLKKLVFCISEMVKIIPLDTEIYKNIYRLAFSCLSQLDSTEVAWQKAASSFITSFEQRSIIKDRSYVVRIGYNKSAINALTTVYLELKEIDQVLNICGNKFNNFTTALDTYLAIAAGGYVKEAAQLFVDCHFDINLEESSRDGFAKQVDPSTIKQFLSQLENHPKEHLLASVYCDASRGEYQKFDHYFKRLETLKVIDEKLRDAFTSALLVSSKTKDLAIKYCPEIIKDFSPKAIMDKTGDHLYRLYAEYLFANLEKLTPKKIENICNEIVSYSKKDNPHKRQVRYLLRSMSSSSEKYFKSHDSKEAMTNYILIGKGLMKVDSRNYDSLKDFILNTTFLLYYLGDKVEMDMWTKSLNKSYLNKFREYDFKKRLIIFDKLYKTTPSDVGKKKAEKAKEAMRSLPIFDGIKFTDYLKDLKDISKKSSTNSYERNNLIKISLYRLWKDFKSKSKTQKEPAFHALNAFVDIFSQEDSAKDISVAYVFSGSSHRVLDASKKTLEKLLKQPRISNPQTDFHKEVKVLLNYYLGIKNKDKNKISPEFRDFYCCYLSNDKINQTLRVMSLNGLDYYIMQNPKKENSPLLFNACNILAEVKDKKNLGSYEYTCLIKQLSLSTEFKTTAWKKAATSLTKTIERLSLLEMNYFKANTDKYGNYSVYMIDTLIKLGDITRVMKILKDPKLEIYTVMDIYELLIYNGNVNKAAELFKTYAYQINPPRYSNLIKGLLTAAQADAFFEELKSNDNIQLLAKTYLGIRNVKSENMLKYFEAFEKNNLLTNLQKKQFLRAFLCHPKTEKLVTKYGDLFFKDFSPNIACATEDDNIHQLYAEYIISNLDQLSTKKIKSICKEIVAYSKKSSSQRRRVNKLVTSIASKEVNHLFKNHTKDDIRKYIIFGKELQKNSKFNYSYGKHLIVNTTLLLYYLDDKEALNNWMSKIDIHKNKYLKIKYFKQRFNLFKELYCSESGVIDDERVKKAEADIEALSIFKKKK